MSNGTPDDELGRFARGELNTGENRRIVRHLISTWRTCRREIGQLWDASRLPIPRASAAPDYGPAFHGLPPRLLDHSRTMAGERRLLPALVERMRGLPATERRRLLASGPEFHTWAFGEWLIEESQRTLDSAPGHAGELADAAVAVVEALSPETYGAALVHDLRARAWAWVGEVRRRRFDLREAEEAFATAETLIARGTGDALEEAQMLELKAALFRDQHRAEEAHHLLDEVVAIYRQYRDVHLVGRAFVQKGRVCGRTDAPEKAVHWLRKGLGLIDPERDRTLDLSARQSLMLYLTESGRSREARFLLKASRPEFLRHGSPVLLARLRWLEGKIYDALGFPTEAERALLDARQALLERGVAFGAAAASLDLAGLYAAQGRAADARALAEEILPIFQSRDLHREAISALLAVQQAARRESGTQLLAEIRFHLDRARRDPRLRFAIS